MDPPFLSYMNHFMVTVLIRSKRLVKGERYMWKVGHSSWTVEIRLRMRGPEWNWLVKSFSFFLSFFTYELRWFLLLITV